MKTISLDLRERIVVTYDAGEGSREAVETAKKFEFIYLGGSSPGEIRRISPGLVFRVGEFPHVYVMGFCHLRQQERVFRVDRMRVVI